MRLFRQVCHDFVVEIDRDTGSTADSLETLTGGVLTPERLKTAVLVTLDTQSYWPARSLGQCADIVLGVWGGERIIERATGVHAVLYVCCVCQGGDTDSVGVPAEWGPNGSTIQLTDDQRKKLAAGGLATRAKSMLSRGDSSGGGGGGGEKPLSPRDRKEAHKSRRAELFRNVNRKKVGVAETAEVNPVRPVLPARESVDELEKVRGSAGACLAARPKSWKTG